MGVKENIRKIIDTNDDLTIRGVSLAAGLSDSALHKFLTKPDQSISVANLEKVASILGVPPGDLFYEGRSRPKLPLPNADELEAMVARAMKELPVGATNEDYQRVVASSLHAQLEQLKAVGGFRENQDSSTAPGTDAPPPAPTKRGGQAKSRNP